MSRWAAPRFLFAVVLAEIVLYVALDALAQSLPPHYSPIRDPESDLAVGPYGYIMAINFLNRGVLSLVFLYALSKSMTSDGTSKGPSRRGGLLFGIWAVGAILLAFFPTDVPATPVSWHGAVHLIVAILAFFGGALGALLLSLQMKSQALGKARSVALALPGLVVASLLLLLGTSGTSVGGLTERIFLGSVLLWIAFVSAFACYKWGLIRQES
jgi:hypothetical membrane protein